MNLASLTLTNFRNFPKLTLELSPGLNLFIGPNAQGKTNLLEAVHLLSTTRSFRTSRDQDLIYFNETSSYVGGGDVEVVIFPNEKQIRLHGKQSRAAEVLGVIRSVLFTPQDMDLLSGSPQGRRAFLDELISRIDRRYLLTLISYHKTLRQRNKLLQLLRERRSDTTELESWDELLVRDGSEILRRRFEVIRSLQAGLDKNSTELLGSKVNLTYQGKLVEQPSLEDLKAQFSSKLTSSREVEIRTATSTTGPHRDDFEMKLSERNLGRFGSRGEQRSAILALKLSEVALDEAETGERPILLLDDVLSELDQDHQQRLLSEVTKQQTLISDTSLDPFPKSLQEQSKIFYIEKGNIK